MRIVCGNGSSCSRKIRCCEIPSENAQVSAEKVDESRFMPEIAGQHSVFHRQLRDVRGTSYCTNLCRLSRKYVVILFFILVIQINQIDQATAQQAFQNKGYQL